jgi:mycothiol synthase
MSHALAHPPPPERINISNKDSEHMSSSIIANDTIELADAPAIDGLTFRRFRGPSDYPHMIAVIDAGKVADRIERTETVEDLARNYAHLTNCDPYQDMLFAEVSGEVIAYSRVTWWQEENGPRVYLLFGFIKPAWRRKGIGTAMLRANERRLREIAATHPDTGPRFLQSWAADTETTYESLLQRAGYTAIRYAFEMVRPSLDEIPAFELPEGLEVRPVEQSQMRAIWEADQEAFKDHWGYSPGTEEDYKAFLDFPYSDPSLWRVAWDGDQVAGQVRSFINHNENVEYSRLRGYTEFISVRRPYRRRGLARALIAMSLGALKDRGMREAALGVDAENPSGALRVYEDCGFRVMKRSTTYRKPLDA